MRLDVWKLTALLLPVAALAGCRQPQYAASEAHPGAGEMTAQAGMDLAAAPPSRAMGEMKQPEESATLDLVSFTQTQRYIIRDATVLVEVRDARKAGEALSGTAKRLGGYVGDSTEEVDAIGVRTVTIQVRVPADRFDDLMKTVDAQGAVLSRHVGTQDVTEEYVDVDAKLRNLKRTEARLLGHLDKTGKLADTLAVEREISRVRMEVEQYEGRLRYLKHSVSFSTATVTCREKAKPGPAIPPESYSTGEVASSAARSLVDFARSLWSRVIWIAVWTPVWLPLAALLLYVRHRRSGSAHPKQ